MNCHFCGEKVIWGADFSYEDFGLDGEGIIATLSCSKCPASYEAYLPLEEEE